ncbi:dipeptidyl peptidase 3 [Anaeramoeba flamelloides]|uniref:Dipeptidyl peptidase 3 n=1 Tax=Anaeramoeba flamelloides TaxID=1746091 RepID=A0ABQ8XT70_9EUKA|nr:dipeptidyl peptidase 3 [Anaeramoeba flamelloides]
MTIKLNWSYVIPPIIAIILMIIYLPIPHHYLTRNGEGLEKVLQLEKKQYIANKTSVSLLDCSSSFSQLGRKNKMYAHYLSKASNWMSLITSYQVSDESPMIFELIFHIFSNDNVEKYKLLDPTKIPLGLNEEQWELMLSYFAAFLSNMGNYRAFGDQKIIPGFTMSSLEELLQKLNSDKKTLHLFEKVKKKMFQLTTKDNSLGLPYEKVSSYYSNNTSKIDLTVSQRFFQEFNLSPLNTKLQKRKPKELQVLIASIEKKKGEIIHFQNYTLQIIYGLYSQQLKKVVHYLNLAQKYAQNEIQKKMIQQYVLYFTTGEMQYFKESQNLWVKDINPKVEFNIGFIETYRDYIGARAEAQGWIAINIQDQSEMFSNLVLKAEEILPKLPWGGNFNKPFIKPDFISIDVLTFGGSGTPLGINIPNAPFNDEGFKNLNLQNSLISRFPKENITFLNEDDIKIVKKYFMKAFQIHIGYHELLGHGSGILLSENEKGELLFDPTLINPLTNQKIKSWYKQNEDYGNIFTTIASSFEECRAESVALFLFVLENGKYNKIFGVNNEDENELIMYTDWLILLRSAIMGLKHYSPESATWLQAHSRARFAILTEMMKVDLVEIIINEERDDFKIKVNQNLIRNVGFKTISQMLLKIGIFKSTANVEKAKEWYQECTQVNSEMLEIRDIVIKRKSPEQLLIQHNTLEKNGEIILKQYEETKQGLIYSFLERFEMQDLVKDN